MEMARKVCKVRKVHKVCKVTNRFRFVILSDEIAKDPSLLCNPRVFN